MLDFMMTDKPREGEDGKFKVQKELDEGNIKRHYSTARYFMGDITREELMDCKSKSYKATFSY
ncbi:MAG: hypothetical protein KDK54_20465 [Leptospiraceae bacterium]|nr:hypothetical protein [Leptospiraceae bacterium]